MCDSGFLIRNIEDLGILPETSNLFEKFPNDGLDRYHAIFLVGPWQNPLKLRRVLAKRTREHPLYYLPRGGLAHIEFEGIRALKKFAYFAAIECNIMKCSSAVIYSSTIERNATIRSARQLKPEYVIPDIVRPLSSKAPSRRVLSRDVVTFGFLAEISPQKGLYPLVHAFIGWVRENELDGITRLVIGGSAWPGSEWYLKNVVELIEADDRVDIEMSGPIAHSVREEVYAGLDVMVLSSRFESYGLTAIEALSAGCILLASPALGVLAYIAEHEAVIRMSGTDTEVLKAGLNQAYRLLVSGDESRRDATVAFGNNIAASINGEALGSWKSLLARGDTL